MRTVNELYEAMQRIAPLELAESWDNPGLLVNCCRPVDRVLVTLDITPDVVEEAAAKGCGLIVAHHPVIFSPLKRLAPKDVPFQLVQNGISAICMHTNLDAAEGGVNEVLAGMFGMRNWEPFAGGCGRVGEVARRPGSATAIPSRCRSWPKRRRTRWASGAIGLKPALQSR